MDLLSDGRCRAKKASESKIKDHFLLNNKKSLFWPFAGPFSSHFLAILLEHTRINFDFAKFATTIRSQNTHTIALVLDRVQPSSFCS